MTRAMSASLKSHYAGQFTTIATCVKLILVKRQPIVTDITQANPGVVTTLWPHGFATGDAVAFIGIRGMTQVNFQFAAQNHYAVTVLSSTTFSIGADTSGFSAYQKGSRYGAAHKVMGFTNHVRDLTIDNVVYKAKTSADATAIANNSDLSLDNLQLMALLDDESIAAVDIERGLYTGAFFEIFEVNYADLGQGRLLGPCGTLGQIELKRNTFVAEGLGLTAKHQQTIGRVASLKCWAELGDRITEPLDERFGCKVRLDPPTWLPNTPYTAVVAHDQALGSIVKPSVYNGRHFKCTTAGTSGGAEPSWNTVIGGTTNDGTAVWTTVAALTIESTITGVVDRRQFLDFNRTEPSGWFNFGRITFVSGNNAGFSTEVDQYGHQAVPTVQQAGTGVATASLGNLTPSYPATGLQAGDVFWLHVMVRNQTTGVDTPAGWTLIAGPDALDTVARSWLFAKLATGSESGTFTLSFTSDAAVLKMARTYRTRGGDGMAIEGAATTSGADNSIEAPSVVTVAPNRLALAFVAVADDFALSSFTGESGGDWVEATPEFTSGLGSDGALQLQTASMPSAGTISGGALTMSGAAAWFVRAFALSTAAFFTLRESAFSDFQATDVYHVEVGCDKLLETCRDKFDNVHNFRGTPHVPGIKRSLQYPDAK